MDQAKIALVAAAVGATSGLVGVLLGQWMTRSSMRKHWVLDQQKEEYRELLSTLTKSFATICKLTGPMMVLDREDMIQLDDAKTVAQTTIRDRIFIAKEIKKLQVFELWFEAVQNFQKEMLYMPFAEKYALVNAKIVDAATKGL